MSADYVVAHFAERAVNPLQSLRHAIPGHLAVYPDAAPKADAREKEVVDDPAEQFQDGGSILAPPASNALPSFNLILGICAPPER